MKVENAGRPTPAVEESFNELLKQELENLQKEFRFLEHNRHGIAQQETWSRIRAKRSMPLLERQQEDLGHELRNATCQLHMRRVDDLTSTMDEALRIYERYQQEIGNKIKQVKENESHVDKITAKIVKQKVRLLALHGKSKSMTYRYWELGKANDKLYNIYENRKLREEILDFLRERSQFLKIHDTIKQQITLTKKKMLSVVQLAIRTYDSRDEAMVKVRALREREEKESKQHGMDIQEFERTYHHDQKMLLFIKTKMRRRESFEKSQARKLRHTSAKNKELDAVLRRYEQSFKRVLAYSHVTSIAILVDRYQKLDRDNYEKFRQVTNLNNECEILRQACEPLKSRIEEVDAALDARKNNLRQKQRNLQLTIISQEEILEKLEKQKAKNDEKLSEIFNAIRAAMDLADCDQQPIKRLLGNSNGITAHNVLLCMRMLDLKLTEMKVEHDQLKEIRSTGSLLKPISYAKRHENCTGGPFVPSVMMIVMETSDEDDAKVMEVEPYYHDRMWEYMFQRMVEEGIIGGSTRTATRGSTKPNQVTASEAKTRLPTEENRLQQTSSKIFATDLNSGEVDIAKED